MHAAPHDPAASLGLVLAENDTLARAVRSAGAGQLTALVEQIEAAPRVFVHGAGRSGLALRMVAMRLMHLGRTVHVVGEVTTPAIGPGDLLLTASGSGSTPGVLRAVETAREAGAVVAGLSTTDDSPLARAATVLVVLPAAHKTDRSGAASGQYAGSLFEQGVLLAGDALFHTLWQRSGRTADALWPSHANLE